MSMFFWGGNTCAQNKQAYTMKEATNKKLTKIPDLDTLDSQELEKYQLSGSLYKKGNDILGLWAMRFFSQEENILKYSKSEKSDKPQGFINLEEVTQVSTIPNYPHCISIKTPKREWILSIDMRKGYSEKNSTLYWIEGIKAWSAFYKLNPKLAEKGKQRKNSISSRIFGWNSGGIQPAESPRVSKQSSEKDLKGNHYATPPEGSCYDEPEEDDSSKATQPKPAQDKASKVTSSPKVKKDKKDKKHKKQKKSRASDPPVQTQVANTASPAVKRSSSGSSCESEDVQEDAALYNNMPVERQQLLEEKARIYSYSGPTIAQRVPVARSLSGLRVPSSSLSSSAASLNTSTTTNSPNPTIYAHTPSSVNQQQLYTASPASLGTPATPTASTTSDSLTIGPYMYGVTAISSAMGYGSSEQDLKADIATSASYSTSASSLSTGSADNKNNTYLSETYRGNNVYTTRDQSETASQTSYLTTASNQLPTVDMTTGGSGSGSFRDWNSEFQEIREANNNNMARILMDDRVAQLMNQFVDTATMYAKIIISELAYKDPNLKTIKPSSLGGIAGGEKYMHSNIIFKLGLDTQIARGFWMYGGKSPNHDAAMKAIKAELIGCSTMITNAFGLSLFFPMMATIDFKGFRMLCVSVLPVTKGTLLYGSNNAGKTVHADDPDLNSIMEEIAGRLNLAGHPVGAAQVPIFGPGDIEAHRGLDGRYYCLDFGRIFPPEDPSVRHFADSRAVFYQFLRPELVRDWPTALSSDALTQWGNSPNRQELDLQVTSATRRLHEQVIPAVAKEIDDISDKITWANVFGETVTEESITSIIENFDSAFLHRRGVNLRHLGAVRTHTKCSCARKLLLSLCVARCVKDSMKEAMRERMDVVMTPSDAPFKKLVVQFLSNLLGHGKQSDYMWSDLKEALQLKYQTCLSASELDPHADLRSLCDTRLAVFTLLKLCNIKLAHSSVHHLLNEPDFLIDVSDIESLEAAQRHGYVTYLAESVQYMKNAASHANLPTKKRILDTSSRNLKMATQVAPHCPLIPLMWASVLAESARYEKSEQRREFLWDWAFNKFETSLAANAWFSAMWQAFSKYSRIRSEQATSQEARERFANVANDAHTLFLQKKAELSDSHLFKEFVLDLDNTQDPFWCSNPDLTCSQTTTTFVK